MKRMSRRAELRRRLRTLRASLELSQIDLAERANLSESRYWRIENGYDDPSPGERESIARALKTTGAELFADQVAS